MRYAVGLELLVYPELFPPASGRRRRLGTRRRSRRRRAPAGDTTCTRCAASAPGDDPRGIHWKKTAQTGGLVYQEREAEETLRLSILFDNGAGRLGGRRRTGESSASSTW